MYTEQHYPGPRSTWGFLQVTSLMCLWVPLSNAFMSIRDERLRWVGMSQKCGLILFPLPFERLNYKSIVIHIT